jgi:putative membrane protein
MKKILQHYLIDTFCLYIVSQLVSGIYFQKGLESLFLAGIGLTLATLVIRPVINILLLPLNLITFGIFKWVSSAIALYLVTLIVPGFKIVNFIFQGFSTKWVDIPSLNLSGLLALITFSFILSLFTSFIHWIFK